MAIASPIEFDGIKTPRRDNGWAITNLGAVLFAKKPDEFGSLARKAARGGAYEGKSKVKNKADYPGNKDYAVGFQD